MQNNRVTRAKLNMVTMILRQLGATLCGIVIPRVMIGAFGSVVYGATTSIAQFLSYISLLESGVGRVARGALYKHLAAKDDLQISRVYKAIKVFFRNVGVIYLIYTFALSLIYHDIADITSFDRFYTSGLVVAISISTIVSYFSGISNMTLMHADQKQYLTNLIITATNVINVACIVLLVQLGADVLTVKLPRVSISVPAPSPLPWAPASRSTPPSISDRYANYPRMRKHPGVLIFSGDLSSSYHWHRKSVSTQQVLCPR